MPLYDYICDPHGHFEVQTRIDDREWQPCPKCGHLTKQVIIAAPRTDVYGSEQYCEVNDVRFTSRREYESKMKSEGWEPCGDKVGGARSEYGLKGTIFSHGGQTHRSSPAEVEQ